MIRPLSLAVATLGTALVLSACSSESGAGAESTTSTATEENQTDHSHNHAMDGGAPPAGIAPADAPAYPVGTDVTILADHMPGMEGAPGSVTGAFSTTTYSVSYTPTDGSAPVTDHRWVVHEELVNPGEAPLADGTEVVLDADHMPGMKGATATIDYSTQETVYMVDVDADGMPMTNHKWVIESELEPAE